MRPSEFEAIHPHLEQAVDDIDYFLTGLEEREKVESELSELYDLMAADKTPPEVDGRGKPVQLTEKQEKALAGLKPNCFQLITDEQAEALAALPGEPMSDEGWAALQFALRGGWRESSRQAAAWLRKAGETVEANGTEVALNGLPDEPNDATELPDWLEAMRTAAEYVKTILMQYPIQRRLTPSTADGLTDRLLAGPDDAELSPRELALLEAVLKQPVSLPQMQRAKQTTGKSETNAKLNKLKQIRDFNRSLQAGREARQQETEQAKAATNQQVIEEIERETPKLDTESVEWIAARQKNERNSGCRLRHYAITEPLQKVDAKCPMKCSELTATGDAGDDKERGNQRCTISFQAFRSVERNR
ncbi:hypothetical protein CA54_41410 [Symmachiella macrocystis]|uniref:Uncharacterized protein n=1 Tax=Symmachiella macrocystis TaxID=2527985 RepID=A0A5C6BB54_9PLAN|nr:hypothetical protein [Symmachiella macrocystis]TWU08902.1 hypothetical protein CA54_41410 [Symmachiella macrocystis]